MKKLIIIGFVGKDAEVISGVNNQPFAKFSVATTHGTKDKPRTDWTEVLCNGHLVELAKYIKKGGRIMVEGYPIAHAFTTKDGVQHAQLRLNAKAIELLGRSQKDEEAPIVTSDDVPDFEEQPSL